MSWLDSAGTRPLIAMPGFYVQPHFSPDGQRLALSKFARTDRDVFVYDLQRDTMTRLTVDAHAAAPIWSPDGKHIALGFNAASPGLGWVRADGAGEIQRLLDTKNVVNPFAFFAYGRRLAYIGLDTNGRFKIYSVTLDVSDPDHPKPGKPELFLDTQNNERYPALSPDGRWVAYESDESGIYEVYVRPFPLPPGRAGGKWQISIGGGALPIWSRNGRQLFFQNRDHRIMVTDYEAKNESFDGGKPRLWSDQRLQDVSGIPNYDLAPDDQRFAIFPEVKAPAEEEGSCAHDIPAEFLRRTAAPRAGRPVIRRVNGWVTDRPTPEWSPILGFNIQSCVRTVETGLAMLPGADQTRGSCTSVDPRHAKILGCCRIPPPRRISSLMAALFPTASDPVLPAFRAGGPTLPPRLRRPSLESAFGFEPPRSYR